MAVEENLNKSMYKLLILMLKYIPMLISLVYVLNTALSYFYIDIENILTEMMENLMTTNPFTFKTSFAGDIEIGGGEIKFNLPLTNKRLVLNMTDLETFKEMLITKD